MSDDWKIGYRQALLAYVAKRGAAVSSKASLYGWIAQDWQKIGRHVQSCGLDFAHTEIKESSWDEFAGTFAETDYHRHGIDVTGRCKCGELRDLHLRVDASIGEILTELLKEN